LDAIAASRPHLALSPAIRDEILRHTGTSPLPYHLQVLLSQIEELRKPPHEISVTDVVNARDAALREAEFDHYFERLDAVFEADELELALRILSHLARLGEQMRSDMAAIEALSPSNPKLKGVLRTLLEDGYITSERGANAMQTFKFSNPMLRE